MFKENIACKSISHLMSKDLFVYSPRKRLTNLIAQVRDSSHCRIFCVVRIDYSNEVILGECLEIIEQILDHLEVVLFIGGQSSEQTRQTVDHDQSQLNLQLSPLELGEDH